MPQTADPTPESAGRPRGREFEDGQPPAWAQHATHLFEDLRLILHVVERDHRDDMVERGTWERNRFAPSFMKADGGAPAAT